MVYDVEFERANQEVVLGLHMMEEALLEYQPLSMEEEYLEAFSSATKDSAKQVQVQKQQNTNVAAQEKGKSGLAKVLDGILNMIRRIKAAIADFFERRNMDAEEKKVFAEWEAACRRDPALKNKRVTVQDFRAYQKEYFALMKKCEQEEEALKRDKNHSVEGITKALTDFAARQAKGIACTIAATQLTNMASTGRSNAKLLYKMVTANEETMEALRKQMGESQANKLVNDLDSLGKLFSLTKLKMLVTNRCYDDFKSAWLGPINAIKDACRGDISITNGDQIAMATGLVRNKDTGKTIKTVGKAAAKAAGAVGVSGTLGAADKAIYLARKGINPEKASEDGIMGHTPVGQFVNAVRKSSDPSGPHGLFGHKRKVKKPKPKYKLNSPL